MKEVDKKLIDACKQQSIVLIKLAIANGANVNCVSDEGLTPLQYAAIYGDVGIIRFLYMLGAEVNIKDNEGNRLSDIAISNENYDAGDYLLTLEKQ